MKTAIRRAKRFKAPPATLGPGNDSKSPQGKASKPSSLVSALSAMGSVTSEWSAWLSTENTLTNPVVLGLNEQRITNPQLNPKRDRYDDLCLALAMVTRIHCTRRPPHSKRWRWVSKQTEWIGKNCLYIHGLVKGYYPALCALSNFLLKKDVYAETVLGLSYKTVWQQLSSQRRTGKKSSKLPAVIEELSPFHLTPLIPTPRIMVRVGYDRETFDDIKRPVSIASFTPRSKLNTEKMIKKNNFLKDEASRKARRTTKTKS